MVIAPLLRCNAVLCNPEGVQSPDFHLGNPESEDSLYTS